MHARLETLVNYFNSRNIEFAFESPSRHNHIFRRVNWLSLWFFDLYGISRLKKRVHNYEIIFINDLVLLPLASYAHKCGKRVIYETLDINVHLRTYGLTKRFPVLKPFRKQIISVFSRKEKRLSGRYCDQIIVNSRALKNYFESKAILLYYSSPLENLGMNHFKLTPALVYFGAITEDKGAWEMIELQKKLDLPLYCFGRVQNKEILAALTESTNVIFKPHKSVDIFVKSLRELLEKHYLIGLSLIKPTNFSYQTQEANKDIDYLALGIPIIGNNRLPTAEKIEAGCGVYIEQDKEIQELISQQESKQSYSENCLKYYQENYSMSHFIQKLDSIFE